jgi:predicted ferric reductase
MSALLLLVWHFLAEHAKQPLVLPDGAAFQQAPLGVEQPLDAQILHEHLLAAFEFLLAAELLLHALVQDEIVPQQFALARAELLQPACEYEHLLQFV